MGMNRYYLTKREAEVIVAYLNNPEHTVEISVLLDARNSLVKQLQCPKRESGGVQCEKQIGHDGDCACPKALSEFVALRTRVVTFK